MVNKTLKILGMLLLPLVLILIFTPTDDLDDVKQPHFTKTNLSYAVYINSSFEYQNETYRANDTLKEKKIHRAFEIIENASGGNLNFYEIPYEEKPDIDVWAGTPVVTDYCDNALAYERNLSHETNGWGSVSEYKTDGRIDYSEITLCSYFRKNYTKGEYYSSWDIEDYPETEVHEILHTLGFDHKNETCHIMNPYSQGNDCPNLTINKDISNCLKYIYSNGETSSCEYQNFMI